MYYLAKVKPQRLFSFSVEFEIDLIYHFRIFESHLKCLKLKEEIPKTPVENMNGKLLQGQWLFYFQILSQILKIQKVKGFFFLEKPDVLIKTCKVQFGLIFRYVIYSLNVELPDLSLEYFTIVLALKRKIQLHIQVWTLKKYVGCFQGGPQSYFFYFKKRILSSNSKNLDHPS